VFLELGGEGLGLCKASVGLTERVGGRGHGEGGVSGLESRECSWGNGCGGKGEGGRVVGWSFEGVFGEVGEGRGMEDLGLGEKRHSRISFSIQIDLLRWDQGRTQETPPSKKRWRTASLPKIGCLPSRMRKVPSILDRLAMVAASSLALVGLEVYSVKVVLEGIGGTMRVG
jgi:hypothetical protein